LIVKLNADILILRLKIMSVSLISIDRLMLEVIDTIRVLKRYKQSHKSKLEILQTVAQKPRQTKP
jgi:hypothetical protein